MCEHNLLETQNYFECQHNLALLYENTRELDSLVEVEHLDTALCGTQALVLAYTAS